MTDIDPKAEGGPTRMAQDLADERVVFFLESTASDLEIAVKNMASRVPAEAVSELREYTAALRRAARALEKDQ